MNLLIYVAAITLLWVIITGQLNLEVLVVGVVIGVGLMLILRPAARPVNWRRLPDQALAAAQYLLALFVDIALSGFDVARRVLSPDMGLKLGIIAVPTQDPERSTTVLALSADYISLTPGELVVEVDENHIMYVHCLDVDASAAKAEAEQLKRLRLLKRIMGRAL